MATRIKVPRFEGELRLDVDAWQWVGEDPWLVDMMNSYLEPPPGPSEGFPTRAVVARIQNYVPQLIVLELDDLPAVPADRIY